VVEKHTNISKNRAFGGWSGGEKKKVEHQRTSVALERFGKDTGEKKSSENTTDRQTAYTQQTDTCKLCSRQNQTHSATTKQEKQDIDGLPLG
jgi:hypothetical protein